MSLRRRSRSSVTQLWSFPSVTTVMIEFTKRMGDFRVGRPVAAVYVLVRLIDY